MTNKTRQTGDAKNIKVALFQPALPKYRIPVFNALGASPGIELTVLPSPKLAGSSLPQADGAETFEVVWAPMYRKGPFFRQPGLHEELKPGRFDVVIFSWYTRNLDLGKAIRRARQLGMPVALWGHGYSKNESAWRTFLRNRQARRADALIFYNNTARDKLIKHSFRPETLFVAANTLDQGPIQAAREYWLQHPDELKRFQQEHELENRP
ncbi:MAG TPA: hypothetical protein ENJ06_03465, partial [Phycisphaeraceae bacterium]|nr:hypothetical protein [Phycisphaeraceae bacterium]